MKTSVIIAAVASCGAPGLMTIFDPLFWSLDMMISGH